jgi:hypothetical protein
VGQLKTGKIYRYSRPYNPVPEIIDNFENYFSATNTSNRKLALLDSGINPIAAVKNNNSPRIPAILISSSPHKIGSEDTPWQDVFEPDFGRVKYYGDNKSTNAPESSNGNKALLNQFKFHTSPDPKIRELASPILFFQRQTVSEKKKGFVKFYGYGLINSATLVTQFQKKIGYFTNYVYEFVILDLSKENEELDWRWISDRSNPTLPTNQTLQFAPYIWREWEKNGHVNIEKYRKNVSKTRITRQSEQKSEINSREETCLKAIYLYYTNKKHNFELLASRVVQGIISRNGGRYKEGWITKKSGDGGVDFIGRVDLGSGFSTIKIVVLGQAKCESPDKSTSGKDLARTVARLKRGWIGAYVTTGTFSDSSQIEMLEDQFPLLTVNGYELARETLILQEESGASSLVEFLDVLDNSYASMLHNRRPEDILSDDI